MGFTCQHYKTCLRSSSSRTSIFQKLRRDSKNRRWVITFYLNASDYFNYSKEYFQTQSASLSYIYDGCYANLCKTSHSISPIKGLWHPTCCWYMWSLDSHIKYTGGLPPTRQMCSQQMSHQGFYYTFTDCETLLILRRDQEGCLCMRRRGTDLGNTHRGLGCQKQGIPY